MDPISEYSTKLIKYNPNNEEKISQFLKSLSPISHITFESENCKVDLDDKVLVKILVEFQTKKGCKYNIWKYVEDIIDLYEFYNDKITRHYQYDLEGKCTYYDIRNTAGNRGFTWTSTSIELVFGEDSPMNDNAKTYDIGTRKLTKLSKKQNGRFFYSIKRISPSELAVESAQYMPVDPKLGDALKDFNEDSGLSDNITPESVLYDNWKL
jgi:hypothetical protein